MMRRALAVLTMTIVIAGTTAVPAHAAEERDAILSGTALASASVAVAAVNPNFDLWPVYSSSEMDNTASHTLSAGFWPGFLIDAFFWLYKFQPVERGAMGIAESLWPSGPLSADASSSRYLKSNGADLCGFTLGGTPAEAPCRTVWDPLVNGDAGTAGTAHGASALTDAHGDARGAELSLPGGVTVGSMLSTSSTHATNAHTAHAEATELVDTIEIGPSLRISSIASQAITEANGIAGGATAQTILTIGRVTFNGQPATIDDQGVHVLADDGSHSANDTLRAQGFDVRLFQGHKEQATNGTAASATSGGLVIGIARDRIPEPLPTENATACAAIAASPLNQEITHVNEDVDNPLYGVVPFVPMDKSYHVDQSVPPVIPCPYLDRATELRLVLGTAAAGVSSHLLPPVAPVGGTTAGATGDRVSYDTVTIPGTPGVAGPPAPVVRPGVQPAFIAPRPRIARGTLARAVADQAKVLYGVMWLALVMIVAGRFSFRSLMRS